MLPTINSCHTTLQGEKLIFNGLIEIEEGMEIVCKAADLLTKKEKNHKYSFVWGLHGLHPAPWIPP
jgi:hypothetical protein